MPTIPRTNEGQRVSSHNNLVILEKVMNYLMTENQFFQCHQFELYLYLLVILLFVTILRDESRSSENTFRVSSALLPLFILYIGYLIYTIQKLKLRIETSESVMQLTAILSYLIFIVDNCV